MARAASWSSRPIEDRKSYYLDGDTLVFDRPLGIRRNKVVLLAGYEVVDLSVLEEILTEPVSRIGITFVNGTEGETKEDRLAEHTYQDRDVVYFLQQPESHASQLYHDYTESRPGSLRSK